MKQLLVLALLGSLIICVGCGASSAPETAAPAAAAGTADPAAGAAAMPAGETPEERSVNDPPANPDIESDNAAGVAATSVPR